MSKSSDETVGPDVGSDTTASNGVNEWSIVFRGAECRLWSGVYNGLHVVKKERFVKNYRITELNTKITKERIRAEVRAIMKVKEKSPELGPIMPSILFVDQNNIIMTLIEDSVNVSQYLSDGQSDEVIDSLLVSLGQVIARIHNCGVIHGDLTTSNFMIKPKQNLLIPIDFGLASFSTSAEDRAVDLYVLEKVILSSHPDIHFDKLLQSYDENIVKTPKNDVLKRLEAVRLRGRKRLLIG
ncbi:unnamed protein product [Medioppia subpectinata]|uniref:non-specific serine/threonine protein kinase n=1 Tax=Medioppia subpectinata TaxID=1979941 RepID=A0A7R9PTQ5_9ACAR|nr:unnamed protein product [Medioppia subpectinata]CAG2100896.1 unnamed protein product [Medioppia subpectinata]